MRTKHMEDRMRQRGMSDEEIGVILELGEWNERADRIVLTEQVCAREERTLRKEIAALERQAQRKLH
ncbi:MAG: hypothetical protein KDJ17_04575 [Hyphomicrobiaceae bacterium]|nr:hypothetical protein [Hyphomicrobiaceae bacterium]